jgi:1-acyl-sn-glycerol-3-phosphate acyltransferase
MHGRALDQPVPGAPGRRAAAPSPSPVASTAARAAYADINTFMAGKTLRGAARIVARRWLDVRADGLEHVPAEGPVLLAARHYHHLYDGVVLLDVVPRPLHILVALDWVDTRPLRGLMQWATRTARWPTVLRPEGLAAVRNRAFAADEVARFRLRGIRECVSLLCEGAALVAFPEGFPNVDPRFTPKRDAAEFLPFRAGFASIVALAERRLRRRVPVVPVGLAYEAGDRWRVTVRCGAPLTLDGDPTAFARTVRSRVIALSSP